jgi:hypothetical protein
MLQILNVKDFMDIPEYFSAAVLISLIFKIPLIEKHETEIVASELCRYHIDLNSFIKFNNNKINSLQM